jgi:hypothetical protein
MSPLNLQKVQVSRPINVKRLIALMLCADLSWGACSSTNLGNGITCVQTAAVAEGSSVTSQASNTITATTTGNALIIMVGYTTTAGVTFACSSGLAATGGTVTFAEASHKLGTTWSEYICIAANITGGTTKVTATVSGGTPSILDVIPIELSGIVSATPTDVTLTGTGGGTASFTYGPTGTTAQANEYGLCEMIMNGGITTLSAPGGGFTIEAQQGSAHMPWLDKALSATGTMTCSATLSGSPAEWDGVMASFKASAAAATGGSSSRMMKYERYE